MIASTCGTSLKLHSAKCGSFKLELPLLPTVGVQNRTEQRKTSKFGSAICAVFHLLRAPPVIKTPPR